MSGSPPDLPGTHVVQWPVIQVRARLRHLRRTTLEALGYPGRGNFRFQPELGVLAIAALVVGLLGGALPSIRAARVDPVIALRGGVE
jgi:hypothetical protein